MCCEQPPDAEMRRGASFLRDQGIGGFLDTVVDKLVGALQPLDHLVTDRLPQIRVDRLLRCPANKSKGRDRGGVPKARQLLECLLCVDGQAVQLPDDEVHDVVGVPLGVHAIEVPRPAPLAMIEGEQPLFRERGNELHGEKRIAGRLVVHQLRQRGDARRFAAQRLRHELSHVVTGEGHQADLLHARSRVADRVERAPQWMDGADFVVPIGADHQQGRDIPLGQQILEHRQRSRIEPLQIVEEERQRMVRAREHPDEPPEHELETPLRVLRREIRHGRLVADEERQGGDEVHHEPSVRLQRLTKRGAPAVQLGLALPQQRAGSGSERPAPSVAYGMSRLYWSNLPAAKRPRGGTSALCSSLTTADLPMPAVAGDQHQLWHPARHDAVEGSEQRVDLARAPIEFLGHHEPVRRVVCAEREGVDPALGLPLSQAAPEVALEASRGLIAVLGRLGEQLHDDRRDGAGTSCSRSPGGTGCRAMWQCTHSIGSDAVNGQTAGQHFVQRDAERVEVAAGIDRPVHPAGLLRRHVGQCARDDLGRCGRLALAWQAATRCQSP